MNLESFIDAYFTNIFKLAHYSIPSLDKGDKVGHERTVSPVVLLPSVGLRCSSPQFSMLLNNTYNYSRDGPGDGISELTRIDACEAASGFMRCSVTGRSDAYRKPRSMFHWDAFNKTGCLLLCIA